MEDIYGSYYPATKEDLSEYVSDEYIYHYYFGSFELGQWYKSPFRDERKGSFIITYYNNSLVWRDFGLDPRCSDAISFVMKLFGLSYNEAIIKIYIDIYLNKDCNLLTKKFIYTKENKPVVLPSLKYFSLKENEKLYWYMGKLTDKEIQHYKIYKSEVWHDNKKVLYSSDHNISFVYLFDKPMKIWKAYNPYPKAGSLKFFSNNITNHIQNFDNIGITGSDILFITKSYKDCIVINKTGYDAIAPHSEGMFLDPWDIDYLKSLYTHIYVFYDNDFTGVNKSKEFTKSHKLKYINIPTGLSKEDKLVKDPWDVVTEYDYKLLNDIIIDKLIRDAI